MPVSMSEVDTMATIKITGIVIIILLIFSVLLWIYGKLTLENANCIKMNNLYGDFPLIRTINPKNKQFSYNLRDYYIKTA